MTLRSLLLAILFLVPLSAAPHDFTFTWEDPTERTDGTALDPDTELGSYRMECAGPENATRIIDRDISTPLEGHTRRYVWRDAVQTDGVYECRLLVTDTDDLDSPWSEVAEAVKISAPTDLRIGRGVFVREAQTHVFYAEDSLEVVLEGVPENALLLAYMWHRVSPTQDAYVEGWELAYQHSVYTEASSDRRGTALFWKQATDDTVTVLAGWPGNREFHLVIQAYYGADSWDLEAVRVNDNGSAGGSTLSTGELSVSRPSLAVASWGSRELLDNVQAPVMDGFSALALGTEAGQYSMGAAIGYSRQFTNGGFTLGFSSSRAVSGLAIFSYGD